MPSVDLIQKPAETALLTTILSFRELMSAEDLLQYFRLRHLVYCEEGYLKPHPLLIDVDDFDATSRFIGAFDANNCLVAGARMILPDGSPHANAIADLTSRGLLPPVPKPSRVYNCEDTCDLQSVLRYCRRSGHKLVEFGRTVVDPRLRGTGLGLKLAHALHGLALHHGVELGFAAIPLKLKGFYQKSGGRILPNKTSSCPGVKSEAVALVIDLRHLSGDFRAAYRAQKHLRNYGAWLVCTDGRCLDDHRHLPHRTAQENLWKQLQPVVERIPTVESHGWEPAMARLPLLRAGLQLHDETLRDGLQSPSVSNPPLETKLRLLDWMVDLGIESANLGLPGAGGLVEQHSESLVCAVARRRLPLAVTLAGRTLPADVEAIARISQKAGINIEAGLFLGCSPLRQICEQWDLEQLQELTDSAIRLAVREGLSVMFVTEDTTRTPPQVLETLYHTAIQAGAQAICLTDTVGHANPTGTARLVGFASDFLRKHGYRSGEGSGVRLDWHGHNDRGLAVANCLAAIEAGADRIHATALGVGERVGNASMERLLLQLHRLSGRELKQAALQGYVGWARQSLNLPIPADLRRIMTEPKVGPNQGLNEIQHSEVTREPAMA